MDVSPDISADRSLVDVSIPPGFSCSGCGYDLTGIRGSRCPECARDVLVEELDAYLRVGVARDEFLRRWRRRAAPGWVFTIAVCTAFGVSSALAGGLDAALFVGMWLTTLAILSLPPARRVPESNDNERRVYHAYWLTLVPCLHALWSIPLAFLLIPEMAPIWIQDYLQSLALLASLFFLTVAAGLLVHLGTIYDRLGLRTTRMQVTVFLLVLLGGLSGIFFLLLIGAGGF